MRDLSRRQALRYAGLSAAALAVGPGLLLAQPSSAPATRSAANNVNPLHGNSK